MTVATVPKTYGWHLELGKVDYERTLRWQRGLVKMREEGMARDTIITVEHYPVVTVGKNGHEENFKDLPLEPVFIERGGDVTYHGPGQLVVYFIFNLTRRGRDLHKFMADIQQGIIATLKEYGIDARLGDEHTGVWVQEKKIASIGVAVKRWISFHGAAINLNVNLEEFRKINPCGLSPEVMTSADQILAEAVDMRSFTGKLLIHYGNIFDTVFTPVDLEALDEDLKSQEGGFTI